MTDEPKTLPAPKRPRGAQPGNTNALKDGFYARKFKLSEIRGLEDCASNGLKDEIDLMRIIMRKVAILGSQIEDLAEAESLLRTLSVALIALTRAIRTQHLMTPGPDDELGKTIQQALIEVSRELNLS